MPCASRYCGHLCRSSLRSSWVAQRKALWLLTSLRSKRAHTPLLQRHDLKIQLDRRIKIAKARNYLLNSSLKAHHTHVLHVDSDLFSFPPNIVEDLLAIDTDVVVPMCVQQTNEKLYDLNSWAETSDSLKYLESLPADLPIFEGYSTTSRMRIDKLIEKNNNRPVELDAVGGTMILAKAFVHRTIGDESFPESLTSHHTVETEGFAQVAKENGFVVLGTSYKVFHA